ncbi:MAG: hypothetical protein GC200_07300 [Tepidisphaera sp.]|nr:hypothetical protein [Tepidisphaera sp.]
MSKISLLSLIAGAACGMSAYGQEVGTLPVGGNVVLDSSHIVYANPPIQGGFESRALGAVYDNTSNVFGNGTGGTFLGNCNQVLEDISFVGSPWALPYANPRVITQATIGTAVLTNPTASTSDNLFIVFWDPANVNYAGSSGANTRMITPGSTPLASYVFDQGTVAAGFIWQFTFTGLSVTVPTTANGVVVQVGWIKPGSTVTDWANLNGLLDETCGSTSGTRGLAFGSNSLAGAGGNAATVGTTAIDYGRDIYSGAFTTAPGACTDGGIFLGTPGTAATGGQNEHRQIVVTPTGGLPTQYGYQIQLQGDISVPPPACTTIGVISDTQAPQNGMVASGATQWYCLTLPNDATDANLSFFDADTEGSATDVAIGIYNDAGGLISSDDNSGSGNNAQMSFGVGRRAAVGDGQQYDGRSGQLTAGNYFIAVAPGGSTFGSGFNVIAATNPGGAFTLNMHTNVNGTPLAPSVAPIIASTNDYDGLFGPIDPNASSDEVRTIPAHTAGAGGVIAWSRFTITSDIDSNHFLDLVYCTQSTAQADGVAYIFNDQGDIVYFSDDDGGTPAGLPQFSIGNAGPRDYGCLLPFNGDQPTGASAGLPAGTYYLADGLFATDDLLQLGLTSGHRWHVRETSGSNLTVTADLHAGTAGGVACDPDVNQDGVADQGDVDYLINVIAGGDNPTGINPDFNSDGVADQGDVDALINTIASGMCP